MQDLQLLFVEIIQQIGTNDREHTKHTQHLIGIFVVRCILSREQPHCEMQLVIISFYQSESKEQRAMTYMGELR